MYLMWNEKLKKLEKRNNKRTERKKKKLEMLKIISAPTTSMQMFVATSFIIATSFCLLETNNFTICLLETSLQLMNEYPPSYEWMKMSVYIQDNIFHIWQRMQYWHKLQHRWILRTLLQVKGTSHKDNISVK